MSLELSQEDFLWNEESREGYFAHLRDFAPKSDKQDAPGPFGRFLEDILDFLGVTSSDGEEKVISAASALRSWRAVREQLEKK